MIFRLKINFNVDKIKEGGIGNAGKYDNGYVFTLINAISIWLECLYTSIHVSMMFIISKLQV